MAKNKTAINPMTGEELKRLSNVLIYGITDEQLVFVHENLPNSNTAVIDCSDCFTDIIATAYIAVIINPDFLTEENIEYFNELAEDVGHGSGTLIFTKRHNILNKLSCKVKYQAFVDDFEFEDKIKYILLESSRKEKRNSTYSDTISQTIRVLSEIRKHPYITTAELAEKIERNSRTVQRYITTLNCAGEFIEYDRKKKGWFLWENKSVLWGGLLMNIIHIALMVGLWLIAIVKGKQYFQLRDAFIRSGEQEIKQMISHLLGIATNKLNSPTEEKIRFLYLLYNPTSIKIVNSKHTERIMVN